MGVESSRLTSICSLISDIDHKMPKAVDNGVLFLSVKDLLNDGTINYSDNIKMISEEDFLRLSKKALPQKNDIITHVSELVWKRLVWLQRIFVFLFLTHVA